MACLTWLDIGCPRGGLAIGKEGRDRRAGDRIRAKKSPAGRTIRGEWGRVAYFSAVPGEGAEGHQGDEQGRKQ